MMTVKYLLVLLTLLLATGCATDSASKKAKAINEECALEMQAARTAVRLQRAGKPASTLKSRLKPLGEGSSRLMVIMHEVVDEAYRFTDLNETTYAVYRFEICQRQLQKKNYPASITPQHEDLLACQEKFGNRSSAEHTRCVTDVVERHAVNTGVGNANIE